MPTLGMVGLGLLGSVLSRHLLDEGYVVQGFDTDPQRLVQLEERGGKAVSSPAAAAAGVDTCLLCLPNSGIVREVCLGDDGIAPAVSPGFVVIDTTTSSPQDSIRTAGDLADSGISFLDASLSGSSKMAETRDVVALVGGDADGYERIAPVLDAFTRSRFHLGPVGSGARTKLIVNLVLGVNRLAMAEGLVLGERSGVDLSLLLEVLKDSAAYSKAMDVWGERMVAGDHFSSPGSRIRTHAKDFRLILDQGRTQGAPLWLTTVVDQVLHVAHAMDLSEADSGTVVIEVLRRLAR